MHTKRGLSAILAFFTLFLLYGCKGKEVVGKQATDFSLEGVKGGQISFTDLKGKPVLLYFFASW